MEERISVLSSTDKLKSIFFSGPSAQTGPRLPCWWGY